MEISYYNQNKYPLKPNTQLSKDEKEKSINPTQYKSMVEDLRYLVSMESDLAYVVGIVK